MRFLWIVLPSFAALLVLIPAALGQESGIQRFNANLKEITRDGKVVLSNGKMFELAGIRMRPTKVTQEPQMMEAIAKIIFAGGDSVEVEIDPQDGTAAVYYRQRIQYQDLYGPGALQLLLKPKFARCTISELLIAMAAAEFVSPAQEAGPVSSAVANKCRRVQEKATLALWTKRTYRPLECYVKDPSCIYADSHGGFRPRISVGDQKRQVKAIKEYETRKARIERILQAPEEAVPALCDTITSKNTALRRYACLTLGNLPPRQASVEALAGALVDEDRYVREYAARSLGKAGSAATSAIPSLQSLSTDPVEGVRQAAAAAIAELGKVRTP